MKIGMKQSKRHQPDKLKSSWYSAPSSDHPIDKAFKLSKTYLHYNFL
jgi:hypothetical protein